MPTKFDNSPCHPNYEAECIHLKEELSHVLMRLDECSGLLAEARKDLENLKIAYNEQHEQLIRYEAQIEAFKYVIAERR